MLFYKVICYNNISRSILMVDNINIFIVEIFLCIPNTQFFNLIIGVSRMYSLIFYRYIFLL